MRCRYLEHNDAEVLDGPVQYMFKYKDSPAIDYQEAGFDHLHYVL